MVVLFRLMAKCLITTIQVNLLCLVPASLEIATSKFFLLSTNHQNHCHLGYNAVDKGWFNLFACYSGSRTDITNSINRWWAVIMQKSCTLKKGSCSYALIKIVLLFFL